MDPTLLRHIPYMWSDECFVEFQGCFKFTKMELTILMIRPMSLHIMLVMWVDQDMSAVIWIPRYFTEFIRDSSICLWVDEESWWRIRM